jgi:hypothetical protein
MMRAAAAPDTRLMEVRSRQSKTYAAAWLESDGSVVQGGLTLERESLLLQASGSGGHPSMHRVPFADLAGVSIGRGVDERLNGDPTLLLDRYSGRQLRISLRGAGLLWELADLLARVISSGHEAVERVVVVAPLKEGMRELARALIEEGPPFDLQASGLERNDVFLARDEVIFVFEGRQVREAVERLMQEPNLWRAALDWEACLTGRPELAEITYSWRREEAQTSG